MLLPKRFSRLVECTLNSGYAAFFVRFLLHALHRAFWAAAIFFRADADMVRRGLEETLRLAPEPLWVKAEIAASSRLRSL